MSDKITIDPITFNQGEKLVIIPTFPKGRESRGSIRATDILKIKEYQWDGYRLETLEIHAELSNHLEVQKLINFLQIHKGCLTDFSKP